MDYTRTGDVVGLAWAGVTIAVILLAGAILASHFANQRLHKAGKRPGLRMRFHARMAAWHTARAEGLMVQQARDHHYAAEWQQKIDKGPLEPEMWRAN